MPKDSTEFSTMKRKYYGGLFIPAGLLTGMGVGFAVGHLVAGLFIGLGVGFLLFAFVMVLVKD